jgi:hypothetical protein
MDFYAGEEYLFAFPSCYLQVLERPQVVSVIKVKFRLERAFILFKNLLKSFEYLYELVLTE